MFFRTSSIAFAGLALLALSTASLAQNPPLDTIRVASGLARPLFVTAPAGDFQRAFIVEQRTNAAVGQIRILDITTNTLAATPYLSIAGVSSSDEEGLLGLAFHPNFATNGFFFVYYTVGGNNTVRRFQANAPFTTSTTADAASNTQVITFAHPSNANHNGGWIGFGPDGYLYIGTGDGGSANDPPGNAQNINSYLGKMHRIDVNGDDFTSDPARNYAIPPTNPFAGATPGLDEIWSYGLRNPWRNAFDTATGELYIADVGQNAWEEVDVEPANTGGRNYGWRCTEGNTCTGLSGCTCGSGALTPPVHVYSHSSGCSITGGFVYRGSAICGLQGTYFFADYCQSTIWSFKYTGGINPPITNRTAELAPGGGLAITGITGFGTDAFGEIYICERGSGTTGEVYKIVPGTITDCNGNGIHDACDIASATSLDANTNGIPDECESTVTPYCFGDGTGTACPCGNSGTAGNGCANSINSNGGNLGSTGSASISNDSLVLLGTGMPNSSALYFQGTTQVGAGAGSVFGDGKRCAGGSVVRLGTKLNSVNQSAYPEILDVGIAIKGMITSGPQTRTYQVWYRNAATFCSVDTFNLTNGLSVVWVN
ncbi:MAG: PQQ-dependent sugar dehydrogenase [Planctomycetota bacterium]|nr:PQQ-dependent sugar dehydrogenase [Planctomycetota bacterium]